MYSLERLKELAVKQMRAAADLYETCEKVEQGLIEDNDLYNKLYLIAQREYRYTLLEHLFEFKPTYEEKELWDEIMKELD